jgi:hypothetical protein
MGVGLTIVLAVSMLFGAAPVSAGTLSWGSESVPTTTGNLLVNAQDVSDLAVSTDGVMYLVSTSDTACYKSTNGGSSWSKLSKVFANNLALVAVAPDDSGIVVVADPTADTVWVSTNGGSTWGDLGTPVEGGSTMAGASTWYDMSISNADGSKHYIGVAAQNAAGNADVFYFDLGASAPKWNSTLGDAGFSAGHTDAFAVAFSPNVASDFVMAAVTTDGAQTHFQLYSLNTNNWNASAAFGSYPVNIQNGSTDIIADSAAVVLSPDYLGSDDALRTAFVGLNTSGASDAYSGIYRLKDTSTKDIDDGAGKDIFSIDYDGTNLIAGNAANTKVYRSADPMASSPSFSTSSELVRPGLSSCTNTIVAWNGADVVAGTTGPGSAFAVSTDNGASFKDISFIDVGGTNIGTPLDVDGSPAGDVVYLLVDDVGGAGYATSLYRNDGSWARVLAVPIATFGGTGIVRVAPDDPDSVYVANQGANTLYFSAEGGDTKWFTRASKEVIGDMAVESADVAYVAVNAAKTVSKTTNSGFTWGSGKDTGCGGSIDTIRSLGEDNVLVGGQGYVAWSTDGNSSWEDINTPLNAVGATQVTASGLNDGDYIYAATDAAGSRVERWEIGQSGTSWKNLSAPSSGNMSYGIALVDGTLYVVTTDGTPDAWLFRTLSPTSSEPSNGMWATVKSAGESFMAVPQALKVTTGSTKLWAVETVASVTKPLFSFTDDIATEGPTLGAPGAGAEVKVNPVSGGTYAITLSWERLSKATMYDYQVATDSGFVEKIINDTTASTTSSTPAVNIAGNQLNPETTYYWRVRVNQAGPVRSAWSETRSFTVGDLPEVQPPVVIQAPGPAPVIEVPPSPEIVLQPPEIVLPPPQAAPEIVIPAAPAPAAPAIPAWAIYAIIIIGAVLVIALIVLIMRTRRPV